MIKNKWIFKNGSNLKDTSPKKIYRWQISIGTDVPHVITDLPTKITMRFTYSVQFSSVAQSLPILFDSMDCSMPGFPDCQLFGVYSNSCLLSRWCHPTISSSVVPFFSHLQSFPASGCFQKSQFFTSGGQSIGVSASTSVLPMNIQDWIPLGWTGWISLQSKELSRVFSNTTVQKHQFFGTHLSSQSNSHMHTWPLEKP